jgi:hypothetical protein
MAEGYDAWDEALKEAYASKRADAIILHTLQFDHPEFKENGVVTPVYVVSQPQDFQLPLVEGEDPVTFQRSAFRFTQGKQDGREVSCEIAVDNVTRLLQPKLQAAVKVRATLWCTYRQYISTDTSGPKFKISGLWIHNVQTTPTGVRGTAKLFNAHNRKFPDLIYELSEFKALSR